MCMLERERECKRGASKLMSSDEISRNPREKRILSYETPMRVFFSLLIIPNPEVSAVQCRKNCTFMSCNETMSDSTSCIMSVRQIIFLKLEPIASY